MPGYTLRELECTQCSNTYTDMEGDLFLPVPRLCDDCLKKLWHQSDEDLDNIKISDDIRRLLQQLQQRYQLESLLFERENNREFYR